METTLVLIGCSKDKRSKPCPAKDLYQGELFKLASRYAEQAGHAWAILSAEHHLVLPEDQISPYNTTLNAMGVKQRRSWAEITFEELRRHFARHGEPQKIIFLAGQRYREFLIEKLQADYPQIAIETPLEGLGLGYQRQALARMILALPPSQTV